MNPRRQSTRTGQHLVALPNAIAERSPAILDCRLELCLHFFGDICPELLLKASYIINPRAYRRESGIAALPPPLSKPISSEEAQQQEDDRNRAGHRRKGRQRHELAAFLHDQSAALLGAEIERAYGRGLGCLSARCFHVAEHLGALED